MKVSKQFPMLLSIICLLALVPQLGAEKVTFQRAVELALSRSTRMGIAVADQLRARQGYLEARNAYVPQLVVGSGLAKTWGFPLSIEGSAPSVVQVGAQSALINPAQKQFIRAARAQWNASSISADNQRSQTILDTALTYAELDKTQAKLHILQEQGEQAQRAEFITRERVKEGVDSKLELTKASLSTARIRLQIAEAQGSVDLLRQHLSQLTGLSADSLEIDGESIPKLPDITQGDSLLARALENSTAIKAADENVKSKQLTAKGEHKALLPSVDLVGQYGLFARYNNYDQYFQKFQQNNATLGVSIKFPFLNQAQRSRADGADAEALRAKSEAEATRNQVASETLKLQRTVEQLSAARDVAKLEYELAQNDVEVVQAKIETGNATIRDQEIARMGVNDKYAALLDATFEVDKFRMQLLQAIGDLQKWALGK